LVPIFPIIDNMKLVREYIEPVNFYSKMDFEKTGDPLKDMQLGQKARISQWLDSKGVENYRIAEDLTIDVLDDVNLVGEELEELPEFIKFNKIYGGFYAGGNNWKNLEGFPKEVLGDFQLRSPSAPAFYNIVKRFKEEKIRKLIKIHGKVYN